MTSKGLVKLIHRVKIAHSFLQSVSNLFHFMHDFKLAYLVLHAVVKEFFETPSKNGEMDRFKLAILIESF